MTSCVGAWSDKASEFYALTVDSNEHISCRQLIGKFERRFKFTELPETARITFHNAIQAVDESLDEWADRRLTGFEATKELSEQFMAQQAILRFCHGAANREAGEQVANMRPNSMDGALDKMKWAIHTHNLDRASKFYWINRNCFFRNQGVIWRKNPKTWIRAVTGSSSPSKRRHAPQSQCATSRSPGRGAYNKARQGEILLAPDVTGYFHIHSFLRRVRSVEEGV